MRYTFSTICGLLLAMPLFAHAATIQEWLLGLMGILENIIIPLIVTIAFFVFIWNAFRFFILEGDSDEGKEKAKSLMIWGVFGLVLILIFLGIVNLLLGASGLERSQSICPDYNPFCDTPHDVGP